MDRTLKPKLTAPLMLVGILGLLGVTVLAALWPGAAHHPDRGVAAIQKADVAGGSRPAGAATSLQPTARLSGSYGASSRFVDGSDRLPAAPVLSTITYTVRPGDTRPRIARWFKDHGYAALFAINGEVFAASRQHLSPGWRITIRNGVMTVARPVAPLLAGPVDG